MVDLLLIDLVAVSETGSSWIPIEKRLEKSTYIVT
jgi:hypothetical protein